MVFHAVQFAAFATVAFDVGQAYILPGHTSSHQVKSPDVTHLQPQLQASQFESPGRAQSTIASSWNSLALGLTIGLALAAAGGSMPASAVDKADLDHGEAVFKANCLACHAGGGNTVAEGKGLTRGDLEQNKRMDLPAVVTQITRGGGGMKAWGEILAPMDIVDVGNYILEKAKVGW